MSRNFYLQSSETSTASLSEPNNEVDSATQRQQNTLRGNGYEDDGDYDTDDYDDDNALPFPTALNRNDFLTPTFEPSEYLSHLASSRYQTLEDLRTELRSRSQLLSQELLDLVNAHHDDFTGLGRSLEGGDEKVEAVRVGVLGFRREVQDVQRRIAEREKAVDTLLARRRKAREQIELGRRLLDFEERVGMLETQLGLEENKADKTANGVEAAGEDYSSDNTEDEDEEDEDDEGTEDANRDGTTPISISRITRRVQYLKSIEHMARRIGEDHPFIMAQQPRTNRLRATLLLDIGVVLKQLKEKQDGGAEQKLKVLDLYNEIGASQRAVEILKDLK